MTEKEIRAIISQSKKKVNECLKESVDKEEARRIIWRYNTAISGNFVSWIAAAAVSARSIEARFACEENIFVEMRDNHPGLLESFTHHAHTDLQTHEIHEVKKSVTSIREMVSEMHGVKNITVCAVLENTSTIFIPYLAKLSKLCESNDQQYTDIHGIADIAHADRFIWALAHESAHYLNAEDAIKVSVDKTLTLIKSIFSGE